jgi:hypothetical protein
LPQGGEKWAVMSGGKPACGTNDKPRHSCFTCHSCLHVSGGRTHLVAFNEGKNTSRQAGAEGEGEVVNHLVTSRTGDRTRQEFMKISNFRFPINAALLSLLAASILSFGNAQRLSAAPVDWERVVVDQTPCQATGPFGLGIPSLFLPGRLRSGRVLEKAAADVHGHGDGKKDIVVGCDKGVSWYQFPASGIPRDRWIRHEILTSGRAYEAMRIADLNGDGRPDIILSRDDKIEWLQHPGGDGTGTWTVHLIGRGLGHEIFLEDFDGDGKIDVVSSRTRNIQFQDNPDSWVAVGWDSSAPGKALDGLALLDIGSGNGQINLIGANDSGIYWFENPREHGGNARTDRWIAHRIGDNDTGGPTFGTADVNGDGRIDLIQAPNEDAQGSRGLIWWEAPADRRNGTWTAHTIDNTWQFVHQVSLADFNKDGKTDLLITEQEQSHDPDGGPYKFDNDRIAVLYSDGSGNFTPQVLATTGGHNQVAADIDGDGSVDFFSANHGYFGAPNPIELFLNRGFHRAGE